MTAAAGLAHLPVTPEHLSEAPYVGISFAVFAAATVLIAGYLALRPDSRRTIVLAGALCAAAVVTYVATRVVAFPQIADDVGNWLEPWGVVSVSLETLSVVIAVVSRRGVAAASPRARAVPAVDSAVPRRAAA